MPFPNLYLLFRGLEDTQRRKSSIFLWTHDFTTVRFFVIGLRISYKHIFLFGSGDEPMVILDSLKDWRFEKNVGALTITIFLDHLQPHLQPLATGPPHIRFYAGAPLRTQDGFNVGTSVSKIYPIIEENAYFALEQACCN